MFLNLSQEILDAVRPFYNEQHRYYHNWDHITEGLRENHPIQLNHKQKLAWLFHDLIYIPGSIFSLNESLSQRHCETLCNLVKGQLFVTKAEEQSERVMMTIKFPSNWLRTSGVLDIIRSTILHVPINSDCDAVLDLDLERLGGDYQSFLDHSVAIRMEYSHVPAAVFYKARYEVLRGFLDREFIYCTEYAREHWEQQARDNINKYIYDIKIYWE